MEKYPRAAIVFMTPLHRAVEDSYINEYGVRNVGTLKDYVEVIKEVCEYYAIPTLDLYSVSGIQPQIEVNRNVYAPDGLHPSDAGNELIYSRLSAFLKNLL
jgi:lysophospholipase L1-like esterase